MNAGAAVARGEWFVFLHADSRLPLDWQRTIERAAADPRIVGGSFRFALASRDWRARLIECGVRLRVRLFELPYGDQALFVRRDVFHALGGYADLPLMEDVDLVRRLRRAGPLLHSEQPVTTSARRWERDGWGRRSATNVALASRFLLGASPRALARRYTGRRWATVAMMARAPWLPGKSRLAAALSPADHAALRDALFHDTLEAVRTGDDADVVVACEPASACEALRRRVGAEVDVIAQHGRDLGARMHGVFVDLFRLGAGAVVLVGSDLPDLPPAHLTAALDALRAPGDRVVLGPSEDGGYYLIGLTSPHPELFERVAWGTDHVLEQTHARAREINLPVTLVQMWRDVDVWSDVARVAGAERAHAPRTRAWARARSGA